MVFSRMFPSLIAQEQAHRRIGMMRS